MKRMNKKIGIVFGCLVAALVLSISLSGANTNTDEEAIQTIFKVDNMTCGGCLNTINNELQKNDGYIDLGADLRLGLVAVKHTDELSVEEIADAITESGYPAREISEDEMEELQAASAQQGNGRGSGCGGGGCGSGGCGYPTPKQ